MPLILYSIGSSIVIILIFSCFILSIAAYNVVVFPEPVGPVTKIIPFNEGIPAGKHHSRYWHSKYLGDNAAWELYQKAGLPLSIVYLAAVIGAGDKKATMEVRRAVEGNMPALVGADTTYTYVYLGDAVESIAQALMLEETIGERYLVGTERASTREYFNLIGDLAGVPMPNLNIPESILKHLI